MNDFTKEELQIIHLDMCTYVEIFKKLKESPSHKALRNKLESMIDSYPKCDHRSGLGHYNEKGERVGYDSDIYRCRHCNMLFKFTYENGQCIGDEELE